MTTEHEAGSDWAQVDEYLNGTIVKPGEEFQRIHEAAEAAQMPAIEVSAAHGKLLSLLVQISGARRILEVGTLAGFSTVWMAQAAGENGQVTTCEFEPKHAEVARKNLDQAGVGDRVEILLGPAAQSLQQLVDTPGNQPFDLVFLDADKASNPEYLELALQMSKPGTVIIGDNVVRGGEVLDADSEDPDIQGQRRFLALQGDHPRLDATAVQTVGAKGWDGFSIAVVR